MNYLDTLKEIQKLGRFPNFRITSIYRKNSPSHRENGAIDILPIFSLLDNTDENMKTLLRVLNLTWKGGLGYNWGSECRHIHLDLGSKRRWKEFTKPGIGSCASRMELQEFPSHLRTFLSDADLKTISNFPKDPTIYFPDFTESKLSDFLKNPKQIPDSSDTFGNLAIGGLGLVAFALLFLAQDKKNGLSKYFSK